MRRGQRDRVGAADGQVAGVDAEADVGPGDDLLDLVAPLDHRADVRV
jgi:hypothetical protein